MSAGALRNDRRIAPAPPLEAGDRLNSAEFERRYAAMPLLKKAELIEGEVHMPSPVRWNEHASPHASFIWWLVHYRLATRGIDVGDNGTLRLDLDNQSQPDAGMIRLPQFGGQVQFDDEGYVVGGPELLGEISASTVSIDLNKKFRVYRRHQVREYIVWRVLEREIDWFALRQSQFERLQRTPEGIYRSEVFPGLWLDAAALVRGDLARVLEVLQQGIASPEHAAFLTELERSVQQT